MVTVETTKKRAPRKVKAKAKPKRKQKPAPLDLQAILAPMRKAANKDLLCCAVDDHRVIRLLDAWRNIPSRCSLEGQTAPEGAKELWFWLWEHVDFDIDMLATSAKLKKSEADALLTACVTARIVYPDGTIPKAAATLIVDHNRARYPGKAKGRPRGSVSNKSQASK